MVLRQIGISSLILAMITTLSCARTVTERETPLFLEIKVTMREPIDTQSTNYFIIFSRTASPNISLPLVNPSARQYFPTPGRQFKTDDITFSQQFDANGITPFYKDFYSSWSDYYVIYQSTSTLYSSGDAGFNATTTDNNTYAKSRNPFSSNLSIIGNVMTFSFDLSAINQSLSGTQYFMLATSKITDGSETGYFRDKLDQEASIPIKIYNSTGQRFEIENSALDGASDIIEWEARLF